SAATSKAVRVVFAMKLHVMMSAPPWHRKGVRTRTESDCRALPSKFSRRREARQRDAGLALDLQLYRHVDRERPRFLHDVRDEPWSFGELDHRHVVRQAAREIRVIRVVINHPAHEPAAARRGLPLRLRCKAARALAARGQPCMLAGG